MDTFLQRYIDSWRFNGWLRHDIILAILFGIGILLIIFILAKHRKAGRFLILFMLYVIVSNFIMIVFGMAGRSFPINAESSVYTDPAENIAVQMVRGSENNGTSNGITQIIPHYQMVAIDLHTGEKKWTKSFASREKLVGTFMGGLLIHHYDKENGQLSLLDIQTGKEKIPKKEFAQKNKRLVDLLSNSASRLAVLDNMLYLEGIDGRYYQFDGKQLKENPNAKEYLSNVFFVETKLPNYYASYDQPLDFADYENISKYIDDILREPSIQPFENLEPKVVNLYLKNKTALVSYLKTKQENAEQILLAYDMKQHRINWESNIGKVNGEQKNPGVTVLENYFAIQAGDTFALLDKKTGKVILRYELRWNRPVR